jgi:queuine tRNA-ribosyltransferase
MFNFLKRFRIMSGLFEGGATLRVAAKNKPPWFTIRNPQWELATLLLMALRFEILMHDGDAGSHARVGRVTTAHGSFDTPAFMPVGTQGSIKGLWPHQVAALGTQTILANTYHLMLRPGSELVRDMGGLHRWMRWDGPILTDSGGFQVFSLAELNKITDAGVVFKSHIDGARIDLTPQRSMQVQNELGADMIMAFDDCPPMNSGVGCRVSGLGEDASDPIPDTQPPHPHTRTPTPDPRTTTACDRTARWLDACVAAHARPRDQALFGIVQGGTDLALRSRSVEQVCAHDLPGFAIGGVAVGEGYDELCRVVRHTAPLLPADKPRYLMGVGYERDIVAAVRAGVDMFDCVLPTRNGRSANAFTRQGQIRLRNARFARDASPIEADCDCPVCGAEEGPRAKGHGPSSLGPFSRSYLRHLFMAGEMLGPIMVSVHNIRHFQRLLLDIRRAIADNDWSYLYHRWPVLEQPT